MASLEDYFEVNRYKPKYQFMTRVIGTYKKTPFVGHVGSDSVVSEKEGPMLTILLDLPIRIDGEVRSVLKCKHKDVRPLKELKL